MATAWEEISRPRGLSGTASGGSHTAYFFDDSREKQRRLFQLSADWLNGPSFVLYIAGKQGTKGIRLSMKDAGIDVASFERQRKLKIADSEEFYLNTSHTSAFKLIESILGQLQKQFSESKESGAETLVVISETDQLVRKGFLENYLEFEKAATPVVQSTGIVFVCAYDARELVAARVSSDAIAKLHEKTLS